MSTQQNTAEAVEDEMRKMHVERIQLVTDTIANDLLVEAAKETPKLPEEIFVTHFLPVFSGEKTLVGNSDTLEIWLGIAGSHTSEVSIINKEGHELFRVPPLVDTSHINTLDRDPGNSFADITALSMLYSNNIMAEGERYLTQNVNKKMDEIVSEPTYSNKERWDAIMRRYDKLPNNASKTPINKTESDDLIEYDDT